MPKKSSPLAPGDATLRDRFDTGTQNFARLFTKWMDTNGWSHPIMVSLATACLELPDGKGWLHSSQISGLRHAPLLHPYTALLNAPEDGSIDPPVVPIHSAGGSSTFSPSGDRYDYPELRVSAQLPCLLPRSTELG